MACVQNFYHIQASCPLILTTTRYFHSLCLHSYTPTPTAVPSYGCTLDRSYYALLFALVPVIVPNPTTLVFSLLRERRSYFATATLGFMSLRSG